MNRVEKLSIFNNEIGEASLAVLKKYYLEDIKSLSLGNITMSSTIRAGLFEHIAEYTY